MTAASPATAPVTIPKALGALCLHERSIHVVAAAAAAVLVVTKALAATPFAARAEPALKPNQPNQSRAAPMTVVGMLCGSIGSVPKPFLAPITAAMASAETPALM
ncbi:Uncharacterised protein [uncultured archaeon]|nr:Uncharacterised protein [uncultured archaeon]